MRRLVFGFLLIVVTSAMSTDSFAEAQKTICKVKGSPNYIVREKKTFSFFVEGSDEYLGDCAVFNTFGMEPLGVEYRDSGESFSAYDKIVGSVDVTKGGPGINGFYVEFKEIYDIRVLERYADRIKSVK